MTCDAGILEIDLENALACGCNLDIDNQYFHMPPGAIYNRKTKEITNPNGKSFNCRLLDKNNPKDLKKLKKFGRNKTPLLSLDIHRKINK